MGLRTLISNARSLLDGLSLTFRHARRAVRSRTQNDISAEGYFRQPYGIETIQFPHQEIPIPETGRYKLYNEIDDCIVCDKCAKVCPVNCISIESIRAGQEFGKTSDGTPKRIHAAKFDIDLAKCCFCGLCTTVCPTECLTMTKDFNYSTDNIQTHILHFANLTPEEIAQYQKAWDERNPPKP